MALQIRRGPTIDRLGDGSPQNLGRYFAEGELVYDTTDKEVYIGDGPPGTIGGGTLGGKPITTFTADQAKDAAGATLTDNGLHSNISFTYNNVTKKLSAVVALDGTYNDLIQDTTPELGGNLLLNGNNIIGTGDISIIGDISASTFFGAVTGNLSGNVTGNLSGNVTGDLSGNVTGSVTGTVSSLSNHSTTNLSEGTNLYHTTARARSAISVSGDLNYDSATGVLSYTASTVSNTDAITEGTTNLYFTDSRARSAISVSGDLSYDSSTGVLTYSTPLLPTTDDITEGTANLYFTNNRSRTAISAGTGINYDNSNGILSLPQAISTSSDVQFNEVNAPYIINSSLNGTTQIIRTNDGTITGVPLELSIYADIISNGIIASTTELSVVADLLSEQYSFICTNDAAEFGVFLRLGKFTTTQRDDPLQVAVTVAGTVIFNSTVQKFQGYVDDVGLATTGTPNTTAGWVNFTVTPA